MGWPFWETSGSWVKRTAGRWRCSKSVDLQPDLVLLDIQMPVIDGFEVIRRLSGPLPAIVFVTAYSEYALDAFEVGAVDYLLKPVSEDRLRTAVDRCPPIARRRPRESALRVERTLAALDRREPRTVAKLVARRGLDYYLLDLDDVYALQADGEIVWILTARRKFRAVHSLGRLEERLRGDPVSKGSPKRDGEHEPDPENECV